MPDLERPSSFQDKQTTAIPSKESVSILSHSVFLSKFYNDYSNHELEIDPLLPAAQRITDFQVFFSSWRRNSIDEHRSANSPEDKNAVNKLESLSLESAESFARNKHIFYKTKVLSQKYDNNRERLEYSQKAKTWASRINLAFWANIQQKRKPS